MLGKNYKHILPNGDLMVSYHGTIRTKNQKNQQTNKYKWNEWTMYTYMNGLNRWDFLKRKYSSLMENNWMYTVYPGIPTTIKTTGVNITTIVYLRVLIIQIGSTIILMVVEAQGILG